ncbi:transposase (plasmid) [Sinorhizobium numidicum]|uniref:Transposase n=1 Tax=Sinorhizobium numidicum TaxID=680248 RepID=A0ABY8D478_9HYPH|nr:transposase [Sinorhizobium numidicum]WEX79374.1 transposase [Sinorhizobium numidicum]WEX85669.1 transposase [Sinorhizobium numidicum]
MSVKRTAVCGVDAADKVVWRGVIDTHPELIDTALKRFARELTRVGLESGPFTPHLFRSLAAMGYPMICMDARRAADALKGRRIKSDIGAYLGLTEKRYQSADTDVGMGISKQGDAMARHYLCEAANVLLTTVKKRFALRDCGLKLMRKVGPKRARVAVARKLAVLMGRMWKDGTHFEAPVAA